MNGPRQARLVAVATLYVAAVVVLVEGLGSEKKFLQATSWIPLAIVAVLTAYDKWLWQVGPIGVPVLRGTWKVVLTSSYRDPDAPDVPIVRTGYFVCRQTSTQLSVNLFTDESSSVTLASKLQRRGDNQYELSWVYQNTPHVLIHDRSPIHFGSVIADAIAGRRVKDMNGLYFTSRRTVGDFEAFDHNRRVVSSHQEAKKLFGD